MSDKFNVLCVDDEPNLLHAIRLLLHPMRSTLEAHFATSGEQALELLHKTQFDVMVTDIRMPGIDGTQLLNAVHAMYPKVACIVLTGQADREDVARKVDCGFQYLAKPCHATDIVNAIVRASGSI